MGNGIMFIVSLNAKDRKKTADKRIGIWLIIKKETICTDSSKKSLKLSDSNAQHTLKT
jgi:hypothetical protein